MWILLAMLIATVNSVQASCYGPEIGSETLRGCECDYTRRISVEKNYFTQLDSLRFCRKGDTYIPNSPYRIIYAKRETYNDPTSDTEYVWSVFENCDFVDLSHTNITLSEYQELQLCDSSDTLKDALPVIVKFRCDEGTFLSKDDTCKKCFDFSALNYSGVSNGEYYQNLTNKFQATCGALPSCPVGTRIQQVKDHYYWTVNFYRIRQYPGYNGNEDDWEEQYVCHPFNPGKTSPPADYSIPIDSDLRTSSQLCYSGKYSSWGTACMDCPMGYWSDNGADECIEEKEYYIDKYKEANGCSL